jgi:hypothetical protein
MPARAGRRHRAATTNLAEPLLFVCDLLHSTSHLFAKTSASCGKFTPHGSATRAARHLGQSADSRRSSSGTGMLGPYSCKSRPTLAFPLRVQKLQHFADEDGALADPVRQYITIKLCNIPVIY